MDETRKQLSERLYSEDFPTELEILMVDALFETYTAATANANAFFLPSEARFSAGYVRRGMLEKAIAEAVLPLGGQVEPQHTYRLTAAGLRVETSHYSLYRFGKSVFTISSVAKEDSRPRFALFRNDYKDGVIPKATIPFEFLDAEDNAAPAPEDPSAWFVLKHGKEPFDMAVPQFAHIAAIDRAGAVAWHRNLFASQIERVEWWVGQRENKIKDDPALVTLKAYLHGLHRKSGT